MTEDSPQGSSRVPYRSPLREEQAARTRGEIVRAARALFEANGFAGTTISAIATRAGVSVQTVYSVFGTKAGVARAIVEQMEVSAKTEMWSKRIAAENEPEKILEAFAQWTCAFFVASKPMMSLVHEAASELADLTAQGNAHRRSALTSLISRLGDMHKLRHDLRPAEAVDRAWILTGVETFLSATQGCGWTEDAYSSWLAETLAHQILAPRK